MDYATLYYVQDIRQAALGLAYISMVMVLYVTIKDDGPRLWVYLPSCCVMESQWYTFKQPRRKM